MQRARTAAIAAFGLVSVLALGACSTGSPQTAVSVSGNKITVSELDGTVADLNTHARNIPTDQYGGIRETVAAMYTFTGVAKKYAKEKGYAEPQVDYAGAAQAYGLPESDKFVRLSAESAAYQRLLLSKAGTVQPTDADLRELYDQLKAAGLASQSYEELKPALEQINGFPQALALKGELSKAAQRYHVAVNPLYGPVDWGLLQLSDQSSGRSVRAVPVHLGGATGQSVVTPAATPAVSQAAPGR